MLDTQDELQVEGLAWALYNADRDRIDYEQLDSGDMHRITHALRVAAQTFSEHAEQFPPIIEALVNDRHVPMWAPGEGGIRAAKAMHAEFIRYAEECHALLNKLGE